MTLLTLITYCQRNTSEAGAPGVSARTVQLTHVRKEHDEKDPNGAIFETPHGNAGVNLNSITADVAKLFPSGAKVKVTFELIKE